MTKDEYERGLEIQGYKKSIADMTIGDIALKFLKKYHLPRFLKRTLVKFAYPLLLLKDTDLAKATEIIKEIFSLRHDCKDKDCPCESPICETIDEKIEQFLQEIEK